MSEIDAGHGVAVGVPAAEKPAEEGERGRRWGTFRAHLRRLFRKGDRSGGARGPADAPQGTAAAIGLKAAEDEAAKQRMLRNVLGLRRRTLKEFMVPRADIMAIEAGAGRSRVLDIFRQGFFTRLPVYVETLDNPIGFVHLKDVALTGKAPGSRKGARANKVSEGAESGGEAGEDGAVKGGRAAKAQPFDLRALVRRALVAPPSMPADILLARMQAERVHLALVIDEYGGVDGLVTIEDLVEQIVGDIEDEHDFLDGPRCVREAGGDYLCDARLLIEDFERTAGVRILPSDWQEDADTLGGLAFLLAGRVPERGEIILLRDSHELEIVEANARQIKRLRVRLRRHETERAFAVS